VSDMNRVLALGDAHELEGFALVGATVVPARTPDEVRAAWTELGHEVSLLVVTEAAASALAEELARRDDLLTAVLP
jgi:vacuolar-type H+-ATPase subunit F/Vma7